ncbi:MAG: AlwI family type II restriction endonuclease [Deinococcota bacterium]
MKAWHFGNTTVRTPYRLRGGLQALSTSPLQGNLVGKARESQFTRILHDNEVVFVQRIAEGDANRDYSDLGRKWRSALSQLGLISHKLTRGSLPETGIDPKLVTAAEAFDTITGRPYEITPNGERLMAAETLPQQQEVFLRSLLAYRIPSVIEPDRQATGSFSPLRVVLQVLHQLEVEDDLEPKIQFEEMAGIIQFLRSEADVTDAINKIRAYRQAHQAAENKQGFRGDYVRQAEEQEEYSQGTLKDYADVNMRYLKATGIFSARGRGIAMLLAKRQLIEQILEQPDAALESDDYLIQLWRGARLPTDNQPQAIQSIEQFIYWLQERGEAVTVPDLYSLSLQDLSQKRLELEERYSLLLEQDYADQQASQWEDIRDYMRDLTNKQTQLVPHGERPAYLEWVFWRAFLAINSLMNKPWEARQFKIDQDFLPINTAAGNRPDMVFEFEDYVLVVEVTLLASSRQEAAEGESVRRHVAKFVTEQREEGANKPVFGLFIANSIDSNTAATFKIGQWYLSDDTELALDIVPITLSDFTDLFEVAFSKDGYSPNQLKDLFYRCLSSRNETAPKWKNTISHNIRIELHRI